MVRQHVNFHHATIMLITNTIVFLSSLIYTVHSSFTPSGYDYQSSLTSNKRHNHEEHAAIRIFQHRGSTTSSSIRMKNGYDGNDNMNQFSIESSSDILFGMEDVFHPSRKCRVELMSPTDLAYIGDVVYELFVRCRHVWPPKRTSDLQNIVVNTVCAESQSKIYQLIRNAQPSDDPFINVDACFNLTSYEQQVLTRGRNSNHVRKQHKNPVAYQESTGFEALLGYMYITNVTRCKEFLTWINRYGR